MQTDDITQLIEEIQQLLGSPSEPDESELIDLASRHDDIVGNVTARLKEVDKLLSRSLRSEATALAEKHPPLNDLVTALDFPEFEVWNDLLMQFGIQAVRELPLDIAAELNDAYSISDSLQQLLQKYRTQSLARAPLDERIATLRRLAIEDTANIRWKTDVQKFETHRMGELKKEVTAATKTKDLNAIAALDAELNGGNWSIKIPGALKTNVREAHTVLRRQTARAELQPLCHELSDAYADFDQPRARKLQRRFFALSEIVDLDETDPVYDIAGPALDWLNEEEARATSEAEFEAAKTALEMELDRPTTIDALERLYHQTVRHGQTLPERLEHRLAERIESLKTAESRRRLAIMSSVVGFCLVAIVAAVLIVRSVSFNNAVAGHVQQLQQLMKTSATSGNLHPVDEYFTTLKSEDPAFLEQPDILGLQQEFENVRLKETGRREQFDQLISQAISSGTQNPRWEDFTAADTALHQADETALNESERARILSTRSEIQTVRTDLQKETDAAFTTEQEAIVEVLAGLPNDQLTGYSAVLERITTLEGRPHVSVELKTTLSALKSRVSEQQSVISANMDVARSLRKITAAAGQPANYRQALIDYTKEHTGTQRAEDFLTVIRSDFVLWEGVDQWNELWNRFRLLNLATASAAEAQQLLTEFESFNKTSGPYPGNTGVDAKIEAFRAIASRIAGASGSVSEQLNRTFSAKTISQAYMVELKDGTRYYAAAEPTSTASVVQFTWFTTTTGLQTDEKTLGTSKVIRPSSQDATSWQSPQTKLASRLRPSLQKGIDTQFEETILTGVKELLKEDRIDPILRFLLVEQLLRLGASGSVFVTNQTSDHIDQIVQAGVSRLTNWVNPEDSRAGEERKLATAFLKEHGDTILAGLETAIADRGKTQELPAGPQMKCVGWLHRNAQAQWVVALKAEVKVQKATPLMALGQPETKSEFYQVGSIAESVVGSLAVPDNSKAREGHLVYVALPDGSTTISQRIPNSRNQ